MKAELIDGLSRLVNSLRGIAFSKANANDLLAALAIAKKAVELRQEESTAGSRGGTMTAEQYELAISALDREVFLADAEAALRSLRAHNAAQGARIAALEADARRCCPRDHDADGDCDRHPVGVVARLEHHITDLEKSLVNARNERDDAARESRLSLRDEFAKAAMEALITRAGDILERPGIARAAYMMADTMVEAREGK